LLSFWGVINGERGHMAVINSPDGVSSRIERYDGLLVSTPRWDVQHGQFGCLRRIHYASFDHGGHVALANRYRGYAQKTGLFKTLAQKIAKRIRPWTCSPAP
jgi:hypothetical protein